MAKLYTIHDEVIEIMVDPGLEPLQALVGGMIQFVYLEDGSAIMMNEKGKIYNLPLNRMATRIFARQLLLGDVLVGPVVYLSAEEMQARS